MYFPYLHARRFDLLALKGAVLEFPSGFSSTAVIEPVNLATDLARYLQFAEDKECSTVVISNPWRGEFAPGGGAKAADVRKLHALLANTSGVIPGFRVSSSTTVAEIDAFIARFTEGKLALLYYSPGLSATALAKYMTNARIAYHIELEEGLPAAIRKTIPKAKYVDVRDKFNKQPRNADYGAPELFTDLHKTSTGIAGFGDYTCLGAEFREGGGPPSAIAIHAVYREPASKDIWIEHFVSTGTTAGVGTTADKYIQAAKKLVSAVRARPNEFGNDVALTEYRADVTAVYFPGLPTNKKRHVQHHLAFFEKISTGAPLR